jgi:hypothetical protein
MKGVLKPALEIFAFFYLAMTVFSVFIMSYMRWESAGVFSTRWELLADCLLHAMVWPAYLPMYLFGSNSFPSLL